MSDKLRQAVMPTHPSDWAEEVILSTTLALVGFPAILSICDMSGDALTMTFQLMSFTICFGILAFYLLSAALGAIDCRLLQAPTMHIQISLLMRPLLALASRVLRMALSTLSILSSASQQGDIDLRHNLFFEYQTLHLAILRWIPGYSPATVYE